MPPGAPPPRPGPEGCSKGLRLFRGSCPLQNLPVRRLPAAVLVKEEAERPVSREEGVWHGARGAEWSPFHVSFSPREGHSGAPALPVVLSLPCATSSGLPKCHTLTSALPASASKACGETQTKEGLAVGLEACSRAAAWRGLEGSAPAAWDPRAGRVVGAELGEGAVRAGPGRRGQRRQAP